MPRTNRIVAYVSIDTFTAPFSALYRVIRLIDARSAMSSVGMRRRSRASRMSCPSLRMARRTGIGVLELFVDFVIMSIIVDVISFSV